MLRLGKRLARAGVGLRGGGGSRGPARGRVGLTCLKTSSRVDPGCNLSGELVASWSDYTLTNDNPHTFLQDDSGNYLSFILDIGAETGRLRLTTPEVVLEYTPSSGYPPLVATQQTYTLTGVAAGLKADRKIVATQATFTQTGYGAGLDVTMPAVQATFAWSGVAAGLKAARRITATQATFVITGNAAGATAAHKIVAAQATFAWTGTAAGLTYTPASDPTLTADQQSYTLTGNAAGVKAARRITAAQATFVETGLDAGLKAGRKIAAVQQTYTLTGNAAGTAYARRVTATQQTYTLTGNAATVTWSGKRLPITKTEFFLTGIDVRPVKPSRSVYIIA